MSYDVYLVKEGRPVYVESHEEGAVYAVGGSDRAELTITYNYSSLYALADPDYEGVSRTLDQKLAQDTIPWLEMMVEKLGIVTYQDHWAPTPGNAGHVLDVLLGWAKQHPDATWDVG